MVYEFDSEIKRLDGKIKWNVIYFPYSAKEVFHTNGKVPVQIVVDGHEFEHTLLPSKNGHYLVYNERIRSSVQKQLGDQLHVSLQKCETNRTVAVPDYLTAILEEQRGLNAFLRQPDYLKREQINFIEAAKKEETKNNRIQALIHKLNAAAVEDEIR
ncbi:YdeI/OmpD-associated family protein [Gorillibacterium sp. sgz500922]|uniref:YdeI/OmpD-associated family protein n=1 Tax=Gorillibacterium sp. sgz500922 TaxID=3446694 RepID=UPI003F66F74E